MPRSIYAITLLFLLVLTFFGTGTAFAIGLNARWQYKANGGENIKTQSEFQQSYGFRFSEGKELEYRPTHAIRTAAGFNYTRNDRAQGTAGNIRSNETLTANARFGLLNDIFQFQLSGNSTNKSTASSGFRSDNLSWDSTLSSNWDIPFWPRLNFNFGESYNPVNDSTGKFRGMTLQQDLSVADFYYSYNRNQNENPNFRSLSENTSHFALLEGQGSFLNKRGRFNFSQQFQQTSQDSTFGNSLDLGGVKGARIYDLEDPLGPTDPGYVTSDPTDLEYVTPSGSVAGRIPPGGQVHLSVRLDFLGQQIDILRITINTDDLTTLPPNELEMLQWELYVRNQFDTAWELVPGFINYTYDPIEERFDLNINRTDQKILVVTTIPGSGSLTLTTVEALQSNTSAGTTTFSSKSKNYLTNFNLGYTFTPSLRAGATITMESSESEAGESVSKYNRRTVGGSLRWTPVPYVSPSLNFNENLETQSGSPDKISRSYGLNVYTIPLEKLKVSFNARYFEYYLDDQKTTFGNRFSLNSKALIYPDLTASWSLARAESSVLDTDGVFVKGVSNTSDLKLNAQLFPKLAADARVFYYLKEGDSGSRDRADGKMNLQYRASDLLIITGRYETVFLGSNEPDKISLSMKVGLLDTDKARLTLTLSNLLKGNENSTGCLLLGSWDISKNIALTFSGIYSIAETHTFSIRSLLTMSY